MDASNKIAGTNLDPNGYPISHSETTRRIVSESFSLFHLTLSALGQLNTKQAKCNEQSDKWRTWATILYFHIAPHVFQSFHVHSTI